MSKTLDPLVLDPLKRIHRIAARFRLWLRLCPRCNSDAPAVDTCWVCWNGNFVATDMQTLKNRWRIYRGMMERDRVIFLHAQKRTGVKDIKFPMRPHLKK